MENESMIMHRRYVKWLRQKRKETMVEIFSAIILLAVSALLVKLWFVSEGFTIQW